MAYFMQKKIAMPSSSVTLFLLLLLELNMEMKKR